MDFGSNDRSTKHKSCPGTPMIGGDLGEQEDNSNNQNDDDTDG